MRHHGLDGTEGGVDRTVARGFMGDPLAVDVEGRLLRAPVPAIRSTPDLDVEAIS
jgi:hypothetical protein